MLEDITPLGEIFQPFSPMSDEVQDSSSNSSHRKEGPNHPFKIVNHQDGNRQQYHKAASQGISPEVRFHLTLG
jgi:hypothetical protein